MPIARLIAKPGAGAGSWPGKAARICHPYPAQNEACGLVCKAKCFTQPAGTNLPQACIGQNKCLEPFVKRNLASFQNGADLHRKRPAAIIAFIGVLPGTRAPKEGNVAFAVAMRTYRTIRPNSRLDKFICRCFVTELFGGIFRHILNSAVSATHCPPAAFLISAVASVGPRAFLAPLNYSIGQSAESIGLKYSNAWYGLYKNIYFTNT